VVNGIHCRPALAEPCAFGCQNLSFYGLKKFWESFWKVPVSVKAMSCFILSLVLLEWVTNNVNHLSVQPWLLNLNFNGTPLYKGYLVNIFKISKWQNNVYFRYLPCWHTWSSWQSTTIISLPVLCEGVF
jgi:hypothetical protein